MQRQDFLYARDEYFLFSIIVTIFLIFMIVFNGSIIKKIIIIQCAARQTHLSPMPLAVLAPPSTATKTKLTAVLSLRRYFMLLLHIEAGRDKARILISKAKWGTQIWSEVKMCCNFCESLFSHFSVDKLIKYCARCCMCVSVCHMPLIIGKKAH